MAARAPLWRPYPGASGWPGSASVDQNWQQALLRSLFFLSLIGGAKAVEWLFDQFVLQRFPRAREILLRRIWG